MNINKLNFSINRKTFHRSQSSGVINPHKHWLMLIRIFFVLAICLIFFSLYLLYQIRNEQIFQVSQPPVENKSIIKEDLLDKITKSFDEKAKKMKELEAQPKTYKDPSL